MQSNLRESVVLGTTTTSSRASAPDAKSGTGEGVLRERSHPSAEWWPERLAALLAIGGVVAATLQGFHVREWRDSGADFKVVYASGKNFLHGLPAYNIGSIVKVFHAYGVVEPERWYAHSPVYPPFTFAALAPVIALPVVPAVYVWMLVSALTLVWGLWTLGSAAQREYGLPRLGRLLLFAAVAASPLVSVGLEVGNVSMVAAPFCIAAAVMAEQRYRVWRVAMLTVSFLLKPHICIWMLTGLLLGRDREDRRVALWTSGCIGATLLLFFIVFSLHGALPMQLHDLRAMLKAEIATGSFNPHNRDPLVVSAQITSLPLLLGYWIKGNLSLDLVSYAALSVAGVSLLWLSRRQRISSPETANDRLAMLAAWSVFGLLVSYHRTPDGVVLFVLLPYLLERLWRRRTDVSAWAMLVAMQLLAFGFSPETIRARAGAPHGTFTHFLLYRQGSAAMVLLFVLLMAHLLRQARSVQQAART